jgi:hypothetical protein
MEHTEYIPSLQSPLPYPTSTTTTTLNQFLDFYGSWLGQITLRHLNPASWWASQNSLAFCRLSIFILHLNFQTQIPLPSQNDTQLLNFRVTKDPEMFLECKSRNIDTNVMNGFCKHDLPFIWTYMLLPLVEKRSHAWNGH